MGEKGYQKLLVWQKADELAHQIYASTRSFPAEERYNLTSQLRRAALSVPVNIVEGSGRQGKKETKQFANYALGSLAETEYLLDFSLREGCLDIQAHQQLQQLRQEVGGLLWRFYQSL